MARVVITGLGALTAAGIGRAALLGADGSAARPRSFETCPGLEPIGDIWAASLGELPVRTLLPARGTRALSDEGRAALCAAVLACQEAGLPLPTERTRPLAGEPGVGIALGTTRASLDEYARLFTEGIALGPELVPPARGPRAGFNTPASELSIMLGAAGPHLSVCSGTASAGEAIGIAVGVLRRGGGAAAMLAGGVDLLSYTAVRAERTLDPDFGTIAEPRPLDRDRAGALPGEAAVVMVLEQADDAAARPGAACLAEVAGCGTAFMPVETEAGSVDAACRAIAEALADAGATPGEVDAVVASACGSPGRDATEAAALAAVFGHRPAVCAAGGLVGDCAGATAAVQVALAVAALEAQRLPETAGLRVLDPAFAAIRPTREPEARPLRQVLTLTVAGGGHAAAILLRRAPIAQPARSGRR
ncbi:MAG TPA: beta-ketoacyl synthase N-terminal-like domain-containing protein [Candidatus Dormibacteraeota bacterium]|nr:beta-ketoacyl synthase N-terminal-like domain-containing protein [Candidatus Dormibacteraeota bacterium]